MMSPSPPVPDRFMAQHCDELVRRGPRPEERAELVAAWRLDCARLLARELAALLPGDKLSVTLGEPEMLRGSDLLARVGPVAANSLLRCGDSCRTALLSFDCATAIALTDRSFGGDGEIDRDAPLPEQLPRSAVLLVDRVAAIAARALAEAGRGESSGGAGGSGDRAEADDAGVVMRSESAGRLKPFAPDAPCVAVKLTLATREGREWEAVFGFAERVFDMLLPGAGARVPARRGDAPPARGDRAPFAAIPLPLEGVLAEFELSLARLERLAPGDTIALTVPGELPLRIGERVLGWGRLGTVGEAMALRLTRMNERPAPADKGSST